jgi:8-oxo-dGTP diphosphatase
VADLEASRRARDPHILPKHLMMMAASATIYEDGKLLVVRDPQGFWAGVGGWIEIGESPEEAIIREIREELGVEAEVVARFQPFIAWNVTTDDPPIHFLLFPHAVRLRSRDLTLDPNEVTGVAWVTPDELDSYEMTPHVRSLHNNRIAEWLAAFD